MADRPPSPAGNRATAGTAGTPDDGLRYTSIMSSSLPASTDTLEPDPVIERYKADIDRTLIRERLKLSPAERAADLVKLARFAEELTRAGSASSR